MSLTEFTFPSPVTHLCAHGILRDPTSHSSLPELRSDGFLPFSNSNASFASMLTEFYCLGEYPRLSQFICSNCLQGSQILLTSENRMLGYTGQNLTLRIQIEIEVTPSHLGRLQYVPQLAGVGTPSTTQIYEQYAASLFSIIDLLFLINIHLTGYQGMKNTLLKICQYQVLYCLFSFKWTLL